MKTLEIGENLKQLILILVFVVCMAAVLINLNSCCPKPSTPAVIDSTSQSTEDYTPPAEPVLIDTTSVSVDTTFGD